jgi:hypothetical protein
MRKNMLMSIVVLHVMFRKQLCKKQNSVKPRNTVSDRGLEIQLCFSVENNVTRYTYEQLQ